MYTLTLEQYVKAIKNNDESAFEAVYHKTRHAVYAMILPIVRDRSLAEDAIQETYIKMLKNIHSYKKRYKFMTWLLTIAKNTALDSYRAHLKDLSIDGQINPDLFISQDSSVEKKLVSEYYLSLLNEEDQQIVLLRVVAELKHRDIAQLLNMPTGTVTYRYQKALKIMREGSKEGESYEEK